jgi:hypothetical protein
MWSRHEREARGKRCLHPFYGPEGTIWRLVIVPQASHSNSSTLSPRGVETVSSLAACIR